MSTEYVLLTSCIIGVVVHVVVFQSPTRRLFNLTFSISGEYAPIISQPLNVLFADALTYCDMTTGPTGVHISYKERLTDIFNRYGSEEIVAKAIQQAKPTLSLAVARTQKRLRRFGLLTGQSISTS